MAKGFQHGVGFGRWRQAGGAVIDMRDMTERHLKNAINLCRQYGGGKLAELNAELKHREDPRFDISAW